MTQLFKNTTNYETFVKRLYFLGILKKIIKFGELYLPEKIILDFGCGLGYLKQLLKNKNDKVINYDIIKELSEVSHWSDKYFNVLVANEVFYTFDEEELTRLIFELKKFNPNLIFIVGISKQSWLNKLGSKLFNEPDSHLGTKITPKKEIEILKQHLKVLKKTSKFGLVKIYLLEFI